MLISFSVSNFRSFSKEVTLDVIASTEFIDHRPPDPNQQDQDKTPCSYHHAVRTQRRRKVESDKGHQLHKVLIAWE